MRSMYFYSSAPVAIVFGTLCVLACPPLALALLILLVLAALALLTRAVISAMRMLVHALGGQRHGQRRGRPRELAAAHRVYTDPYAFAAPPTIVFASPQLRGLADISAGRGDVASDQASER
jgi:hypothetical protein